MRNKACGPGILDRRQSLGQPHEHCDQLKKIYCISGLGADHRLFRHIAIPGHELVPMPNIPHQVTETLASYASRMAGRIAEKDPILLGVSIGGMIALELGKVITANKIVIISSAKNSKEVGVRWYLPELLARYGLVPARWLTVPYSAMLARLGAETSAEKQLLSQMIQESDPQFVKWAIRAVLAWDNTHYPPNIVHLHGTADQMIHPKNVRADYWIEEGSHIMILNKAPEINRIVAESLSG